MKLRLLFSLFIFAGSTFIPCYGQETIAKSDLKIDSLFQLIERHTKEDEEKIRLLNEYARQCFYNYEFQKGLVATHDARILSEKLDFAGGKVMYFLTLAAYFGDGNMNEYYIKRAQWLSNNPNKQLSEYYVNLPKIDYNSGEDYKKLIDKFTSILQYFEKLNDKEIQACVLFKIGGFYYDLELKKEEIEIEDRIIELYTDLGQVYPVFIVSTYKMGGLKLLGEEDEAKELENELIEFVAKNQDSNAIGLIGLSMGAGYSQSGRNAMAIEYYLKSIPAFELTGDLNMLAETYFQMGVSYELMEMYDKAVEVYDKRISLIEKQNDERMLYSAYNAIVMPFVHIKRFEDARKYMALALQDTSAQNQSLFQGRKYSMEGQILKDSHQYAEAIPYFQNAYDNYIEINKMSSAPFMLMYIAECYYKMKDLDAALKYALRSLKGENATNLARTKVKRDLSLLLSEIYDALGQQQKAYEYLKMHQEIRAESDRLDEANRIADTNVRIILEKSQAEIDELEQQKEQKEQESKIQRIWIMSIAGALVSAIILALVLYRNNKNKQKANALLKEQKEEIETTLEKLESTQSQLIQSEKMASLGELTAGIAHEIQNPLNFVNNFSEVNKELIEELKAERLKVKDKRDEKLEEEILNDLEENEKKIKHHGQRAEGIVKGMLQHSRTSHGEKEPTDINALADEYLRLAYHGMRAKDKSFNAEFKTDFDESLPKINVMPQDIGRVLLKLINNAFFAVSEKADRHSEQSVESRAAENQYKPEVTVSTKKLENSIEVIVNDNGEGIPEQVRDKIFQPFFTTKPTGSGTGLGLSLSYDIVKAHGGEIKVKSEEGKGTDFIIQLPNV